MLNRDEFIANAEITTEDRRHFTLRYYISHAAAQNGSMIYGLKIEKYAENGALAESNRTPAFTESPAVAAKLAERFAQGQVTPMTLLEMADEWVLS